MAGQRNSHGKRSHSDYNDHGRNNRRNSDDDRGLNSICPNDTVYRYLCPSKKIGSIMGKGGDIVKQMRAETKAKIRIGELVNGCDDRVVTVYSNSEETNDFEGMEDHVCPSMDALFKVHDRVVSDDRGDDEDDMDGVQITVRLLVPADQIGCCIGKGGQIIKDIRSDTGAQIRILKDNHLPACALCSDELVQISGEASNVRKALFQVAGRLHDNPSRSQHLLNSSAPNVYPSGGALMGTTPGVAMMGLPPLLNAYGGYKAEGGEWPQSYYPGSREGSSPRDEIGETANQAEMAHHRMDDMERDFGIMKTKMEICIKREMEHRDRMEHNENRIRELEREVGTLKETVQRYEELFQAFMRVSNMTLASTSH